MKHISTWLKEVQIKIILVTRNDFQIIFNKIPFRYLLALAIWVFVAWIFYNVFGIVKTKKIILISASPLTEVQTYELFEQPYELLEQPYELLEPYKYFVQSREYSNFVQNEPGKIGEYYYVSLRRLDEEDFIILLDFEGEITVGTETFQLAGAEIKITRHIGTNKVQEWMLKWMLKYIPTLSEYNPDVEEYRRYSGYKDFSQDSDFIYSFYAQSLQINDSETIKSYWDAQEPEVQAVILTIFLTTLISLIGFMSNTVGQSANVQTLQSSPPHLEREPTIIIEPSTVQIIERKAVDWKLTLISVILTSIVLLVIENLRKK